MQNDELRSVWARSTRTRNWDVVCRICGYALVALLSTALLRWSVPVVLLIVAGIALCGAGHIYNSYAHARAMDKLLSELVDRSTS